MLALFALCLPAMAVQAGELAVHGFGTLGVAHVDQPAGWAYTRSLNQRTSGDELRADLDSVLGLQVNYRPSTQLELVGQVAVSALDADARVDDYVELAYVAWRPDENWNLRLGRVNLDAYMISDHRDVGFTYPFIRPPVEFYSRMPTSLDGGDVTRTWIRGNSIWQTRLFAGSASAGVGDRRLTLEPLIGAMVSREANGLLLRVSAVQGRSDGAPTALTPLVQGLQQVQMLPVPQVAAQAGELTAMLTTRLEKANYVAAAAAWDRNDWLLSAEINHARSEDSPETSFTTGYASIGRRFGPLTASLTHSAAFRRGDPMASPDWATPLTPIDPALAAQAQMLADTAVTVINKGAAHQYTTSLGARWDLTARVALKAQWDHIRVRPYGGGLWRASDEQRARANVVAVALDFVF